MANITTGASLRKQYPQTLGNLEWLQKELDIRLLDFKANPNSTNYSLLNVSLLRYQAVKYDE